MMCVISWCNSNQGFISMILSIVTVIISLYTLHKTNKKSEELSKRQLELEKNIAVRQDELQRWQIKIDTYPYRIECWKTLFELREKTETVKMAFSVIDFSELSYGDIMRRLNLIDTLYKESISALIQFTNLFSENLEEDISILKMCVIKNSEIIGKFGVLSDCLTKDEEQSRIEEKKDDIAKFSKGLNIISEKLTAILGAAAKDLQIGELYAGRKL